MSLVQIAFLSFRLAGYFTANAGGEGDSCQAVHLVEGGRFKASCNSSACIIQS